ncbi:Glycosyltransferase involved in cell wall bisynthesis [Kaistia soli DSM 19436]|uniref:Glycosyltransferase involved in cell wall bisynthesis n=1 Tax=Kaistia soli DSM 19436 TaxID=1122133 RepID=A0A1M4UJB1_9HYPH|nr:Glycosyltransferase involved in cell wall bisynthesis [Kaistia soli DSM 19436]
MDKLYIDATVPLRWGPHPPVGIPRVETAIVRQAMRRSRANEARFGKQDAVRFFMINRNGEARFLDRRELAYLGDLVEGRVSAIASGDGETLSKRVEMVVKAIRSGAMNSGKEFDRVSASYISGRNDRRGLRYQAAKTFIRAAKLIAGRPPKRDPEPDPLTDARAACFISTAGLHSLAGSGRHDDIAASLATVLHDLIPLDHPDLVDRSHARNFENDVAWMFAHCDRIITVSAHTAETARRYAAEHGMDQPPSVAVSRLGSFLKEGLSQKPLEPVAALAGQRFALYCSTIEIRKNHIMLLKTWARLIPLLGEKLPKLVFCGRWGWMNQEVEAYLAAHPELKSHLVLLSDMSDAELGWLYAHADFGLYPSLAEGWGLGAVECLDFGLPVLISDTPSLAEATQGLMPIIESDDAAGWAAAVTRAVEEPAWLQELTTRIMMGYLPISETRFSSRVLSLVADEESERGSADSFKAEPTGLKPTLPRLAPWRVPSQNRDSARLGRLAGI